MTFASALNDELDRRNMTQADAARETGLSPAVISNYCTGRFTPTLAMFLRLAGHYPRLMLWALQSAFAPERD